MMNNYTPNPQKLRQNDCSDRLTNACCFQFYNPFKLLMASADTLNDFCNTSSEIPDLKRFVGSRMSPGFELLNPATAFTVWFRSQLI
ncbi:hypothetical protein Mapa_012141 [Marchantia paleacea]|nr:hypothetical protein Mapa_012141 [Marchantia paleacea]